MQDAFNYSIRQTTKTPTKCKKFLKFGSGEYRKWRAIKRHLKSGIVGERAIWRLKAVEKGLTQSRYWSSACPNCSIKAKCTTSIYRRITRWEHEEILERVQARLEQMPDAAKLRRSTVEHVFGTLKAWMGATHFLTKTLPNVGTEMSLHVLAYNLRRMIQILGVKPLIKAIAG